MAHQTIHRQTPSQSLSLSPLIVSVIINIWKSFIYIKSGDFNTIVYLKLFFYYWVEEEKTVSNCNAAIGDLEPADTEMQKACYTTAAERGMGMFFTQPEKKGIVFFNNRLP